MEDSDGPVEAVPENTVEISEAAAPNQTHTVADDIEGQTKQRAKHKCPVPSCSSLVIHLPRHMRKHHKWTPRKASKVLCSFNLRKNQGKTTDKPKRQYKGIICPVPGCIAIVKRIHNHLSQVHKIKKETAKYKRLLAEAVKHEPPVLSVSESSAGSSDDTVVSLSECCKPPLPKMKKKDQVKSHIRSLFERVYSSCEDESETSVPPYHQSYQQPCSADELNDADPQLSTNKEEDSKNWEDPDHQQDTGDEEDSEYQQDAENEDAEDEVDEDKEEDEDAEDEVDEDKEEDEDADDEEDIADQADHLDLNIPNLFLEFEQWLKGPDGGQKDGRCAGQCRRQVQSVLHYIDREHPDIKNILQQKVLRDRWLTKFDKEKNPGTVKSYLGAINQFYMFIKCEGVDVDVAPEALTSLSVQVKLWAKSYRKQTKERFWEKRMEDMETIRTPEQVCQFETSDIGRRAIKVLAEYEDASGQLPLSQPDYTIVRDYLLTILCINNGSRSGTLANMTLQEFEKASEEDGCFVAKVRNHKTFTTHGPVHLVFSASLYHYVKIYIANFRNQLGDVDKDGNAPVFLSWNQSQMQSSQVGAQIGSCWGKVFGRASSYGGATAFRKAAVSAVHETNEDLRGDLANLMVHNKTTADKYYLLKNKGKTAVKTSQELTKIMRTSSSKKAESSTCDGRKEPTTSVEETGRRKWTSEEVTVIQHVFSMHIQEKSIKLDDVRKIGAEQPLLCDISPLKIRDKIRSYFTKTSETLSLPDQLESKEERLRRFGIELPTADADNTANHDDADKQNESQGKDDDNSEISASLFSPTTASTQRNQPLFNSGNNTLFKEVFFDLIHSAKQITKKYVEAKLIAEPKLSHLLKSHTFRQLADKVRTERRIIGRENERKKKARR